MEQVLKQLRIDLDYLRRHDPMRYKEAKTHLLQLAGFTSVSRTSKDDMAKYGRVEA